MPRLIEAPVVIEAAGTKPKLIEEFVGRPSTGTSAVSVARMRSPSGWEEPGQRLEFQEITVVLGGRLRVAFEGGHLDVAAGQAVITAAGEWVRYSTPTPTGRSTSRSVFPPSLPRRFTETRDQGDDMSIRLVVTITAAPGKGTELAQAYKARCAECMKEPGCEQFEVFQGVANPDRLALLERWVDQGALDVHAKLNSTRPPLRPELRAGGGEREDYAYNRTR